MDARRTRYFVAKCDNVARLETASKTCIWACSDRKHGLQPRIVLQEAMSECEVVLIFSVNNCSGWHGYAQMTSTPQCSIDTSAESVGKLWHNFSIRWHRLYLREHRSDQCLSFALTDKLLCIDGVTPANLARNMQELEPSCGAALCQLMDEYHTQLNVERQTRDERKLVEQKSRVFFRLTENGAANDQESIWKQLVSQVENLGAVLLACPFGSQRYNCQLETSDVDMFIVFAANTKDVLGLKPVQATIKSSEIEEYDYTILEVSRFCELLLGGDPKCVETLYLDRSVSYFMSGEFLQLLDLRNLFLTRQCAEKYLRDATGSKGVKQLDKMVESGEATKMPMSAKMCKLVYVIIRLLFSARDVLCGREFRVYWPNDDPDRCLLMDVRRGLCTYDQVRTVIDSLLDEINTARQQSQSATERHSVDDSERQLEDWLLLRLRFNNFVGYMRDNNLIQHCRCIAV